MNNITESATGNTSSFGSQLQSKGEMKNILLVSDDFFPAMTGVGAHLQVVAKELIKYGHKVSIITSKRAGQASEENWHGVKVYRAFSIKIAGFYQAMATKNSIKRIILENNIQIIHHHYLSLLLERVFQVGKEFNLTQVYTYHMSDELLTQPFFMRPFRRLIHKRAISQYNKFDTIISPSGNIALEIIQKGVSAPIQVISNPVGMKSVHSASPIAKKSDFQIFYAGRLAKEKNISLLLRAFSKLAQGNSNVSLCIAGEGKERESLVRMANDLRISSQVNFLGQLDQVELAQQYAACDVFVLPFVLEVQAIVVLEAMRFAKPVIVTKDIACARELVEDGKNGYIVDSADESDLEERLRILIQSSELRNSMGKLSYKKSADYNPETIVNSLSDVYSSLNR